MKIHLQSPWSFPDSTYYKTLIKYPPKDISYTNIKNIKKGATTSLNKFLISNFIKKYVRATLNSLKIPLINAHYTSNDHLFDLIHCAHCLSKNKDKPWVADIEGNFSLQLSGYLTKLGKRRIRNVLLRDNCKQIMPWTESIKKEFIKEFPELKEKTEVVYPAIPMPKIKPKKKKGPLRIIFVSRYFHLKCGLIVLEVMEQLRKEYGIEGVIVSGVPSELKEKYPNLKIYDLMPQKKLFNLMGSSDLFLYPSAADTFGFSLLEAMSFGLPIITINTKWTKSRNEIVKNFENGFIFDVKHLIDYHKIGKKEQKIVSSLVFMCGLLIKNTPLRRQMSKNCLELINHGKFSINERNKKLSKIYTEAINNEIVTPFKW